MPIPCPEKAGATAYPLPWIVLCIARAISLNGRPGPQTLIAASTASSVIETRSLPILSCIIQCEYKRSLRKYISYHIPYEKGLRSVAVITTLENRYVYIDNVSILQWPPIQRLRRVWEHRGLNSLVRDSVCHDIVHTGTARLRKSSVVQRAWVCLDTNTDIMNHFVDLVCGMEYLSGGKLTYGI